MVKRKYITGIILGKRLPEMVYSIFDFGFVERSYIRKKQNVRVGLVFSYPIGIDL